MESGHYWQDGPDWLHALFRGAPRGLEWLSEQASADLAHEVIDAYGAKSAPRGYILDQDLVEQAKAMWSDTIPLAYLPARTGRRGLLEQRPTLFIRRSTPDQLYVGFESRTPPMLWVPAGRSSESIGAAWAPYAREALPDRLELRSVVRGFIGTAKELRAGSDELADLLALRAGVDGLPWGSAYADDPWPGVLGDSDEPTEPAMAHLIARHLRQDPECLPTVSFRTIHSGSIVSLVELMGFFALEIRYERAGHAKATEALGTQSGLALPPDMPMDAATAILGFPFMVMAEVEAELDRAEAVPFHAYAYALLAADDGYQMERLFERLRRGNTSLRLVEADLARTLRHTWRLYDMLVEESDGTLHDELVRITTPTFAAPEEA